MAELEGFICPVCMTSLPGVAKLEEHVRVEHSDTATGKMKANFRQFMDKAKAKTKKKLTIESEGAAAVATPKSGIEEGEEEEECGITNISGIDVDLWPPQEPGYERNHYESFRAVRDIKAQRIAVETNRLLVRLEKLLKLLRDEHSMKPKQLKALEGEIVPWKRDSDIKFCMKCQKEFNIRRRRHHCRLCGDIMCKRCSSFLPISEAYQLMAFNPANKGLTPPPTRYKNIKKFKKFMKDDSDDEEEETSDELRICQICEEYLVRRLAKLLNEGKTVITSLYEKMQSVKMEADELKPPYLEMADSLINGEFHYRLLTAQQRRQELVKLYEVIDSVSKQIMSLKYDDDQEPTAKCQKVQRSIRVYASTYLQENLLTLPPLPTREKLNQIREEKEKQAEEKRQSMIRLKEEERLQKEAALAAQAAKKDAKIELTVSFQALDNKLKVSPTFTKKAKAVFGIKSGNTPQEPSGWTADSSISRSTDEECDDPFELQRQQLLGYIEQAQQAKRLDEVATLKESLIQIEELMNERSLTEALT